MDFIGNRACILLYWWAMTIKMNLPCVLLRSSNVLLPCPKNCTVSSNH